jgi:hypothetical protein
MSKNKQYELFVEKFKPKLTTDDCYTPPEVYDVVLEWVRDNADIEGKEIIRPFYPGGDYEAIDYPEDCVVVDNPPFSIISKICRFYIKKKIPFFLFAPHLTLFGADLDASHIVCGANIVYENGARVKTSFLTNMLGDTKILGAADLCQSLKKIEEAGKVDLPIYQYPDNVLTVSQISKFVERGVSIEIKRGETQHIKQLDSQKSLKRGLFGSGFLCSDRAAQEAARAAQEAARAKQEAARAKQEAKEEKMITWGLSEREKIIINQLNKFNDEPTR